MRRQFLPKLGFTLVELMVVVSIIALLASVAIPKFQNMIRRTQEGQTKGNLGVIRSALGIYYADNEGSFPFMGSPANTALSALTANGKYLAILPVAITPNYHANVFTELDSANFGAMLRNRINDAGGWFYNVDGGQVYTGGPAFGGPLYVNCIDTDTQGTNWSAY